MEISHFNVHMCSLLYLCEDARRHNAFACPSPKPQNDSLSYLTQGCTRYLSKVSALPAVDLSHGALRSASTEEE